MTDWHKAAELDEVPDGAVKMVVAGGKVIALVRNGNMYGALDNQCPHAGGPLSGGSVENGRLVCPWHGREYGITDGQCEGHQGVATYPVEVRADGIFVSA